MEFNYLQVEMSRNEMDAFPYIPKYFTFPFKKPSPYVQSVCLYDSKMTNAPLQPMQTRWWMRRSRSSLCRYPSQSPLLRRLLIALHLIALLEVGPVLKAHAALGSLSHLRDVLFDVLEG